MGWQRLLNQVIYVRTKLGQVVISQLAARRVRNVILLACVVKQTTSRLDSLDDLIACWKF
jgi:hypothetical protein